MNQTYSLTVNLSKELVKKLRKGQYSICLSKKVNDEYNVVWIDAVVLSRSTTFSWTESYGVFGAKEFKDNGTVSASTNAQDIIFSQTCRLTAEHIMEPAKPGVPLPDSFTVLNECPIFSHIGVLQELLHSDNSEKSPIYVCKDLKLGIVKLTPAAEVMVFFSNQYKKGMMFEKEIRKSVRISFEYLNQLTVEFTDWEEWVVGDTVQPRLAYHPGKGFYRDEERLF